MNAEFRAYIDAVADGCCEKTDQRSVRASVMDRVREVFAVVGDAFDDILKHSGPFHCDLHPWTRVRQAIRECCRHHETIGYHGLA